MGWDAVEETVSGRLAEAVTGELIADTYRLVIRDRTPSWRGHLSFAIPEDWFTR